MSYRTPPIFRGELFRKQKTRVKSADFPLGPGPYHWAHCDATTGIDHGRILRVPHQSTSRELIMYTRRGNNNEASCIKLPWFVKKKGLISKCTKYHKYKYLRWDSICRMIKQNQASDFDCCVLLRSHIVVAEFDFSCWRGTRASSTPQPELYQTH